MNKFVVYVLSECSLYISTALSACAMASWFMRGGLQHVDA